MNFPIMLFSWAYKLGNRTGINTRLSDPQHKFTYFVPRDSAWERAEIDYPSAMKKIMHMTQFDYHVCTMIFQLSRCSYCSFLSTAAAGVGEASRDGCFHSY